MTVTSNQSEFDTVDSFTPTVYCGDKQTLDIDGMRITCRYFETKLTGQVISANLMQDSQYNGKNHSKDSYVLNRQEGPITSRLEKQLIAAILFLFKATLRTKLKSSYSHYYEALRDGPMHHLFSLNLVFALSASMKEFWIVVSSSLRRTGRRLLASEDKRFLCASRKLVLLFFFATDEAARRTNEFMRRTGMPNLAANELWLQKWKKMKELEAPA